MSALTAPLPPHLRLVSVEDGRTPAESVVGAVSRFSAPADTPEGKWGRPRLRLVPGGVDADFEPTPAPIPDSPRELIRRPIPPHRGRTASPGSVSPGTASPGSVSPGSASSRKVSAAAAARPVLVTGVGVRELGVRSDSVDALAPAHPAVRARRRRQAHEQVVSPAVQTSTSGRAQTHSRAPRRSDAVGLPGVVRRLFALGALVLVVVLAVASGIVASGFDATPAATTTAVVQSGQSLWDIAVATGAGDVNEVMSQIVDLNGLTSSTLQAGQTLIVPAD
ncbi:LysM peptidoglycan-binding domain-containing protein [Actinomyces qiguomingii]|uniref:LysM peptidoglycan-binding domain-containing protein n=1 Tax=Actinomyces qiguomingii TaxID=2057800 RepID=UPI000CA01B65|nr:LysM peptidoglycan-binding domain-containing protein [Actinomyces qiguomingii]